MYYRDLLNIGRKSLVLEVGPGSKPYWRSDFLVDKYGPEEEVIKGNFGKGLLNTDGKPFLKILDNTLPFSNDSFDWVICSHVLEHVEYNELNKIVSEIFRVSPKAYFEFPAPLYEIFYNFEAHLNFMDIDNDTIYCLPKEKVGMINTNFSDYIRFLNKTGRFSLKKRMKPLLTVGKVFSRNNFKLEIVEDESMFFSLISNKAYFNRKPSSFFKLMEAMRARIYSLTGHMYDKKLPYY